MHTSKVETLAEYDNHTDVFDLKDFDSKLDGYIVIHRGSTKQPAFGATRVLEYKSNLAALKDALLLSRGMSYKAALAGLPYGGAKGVIIAAPSNRDERSEILERYAAVVNKLEGRFITGTDVGLTNDDIKFLHILSRYFVGISVDPSYYTALGLKLTIDSVIQELSPDLPRAITIQGVGKIGSQLIELLDGGYDVIVSDTNKETLLYMQNVHPYISTISTERIYGSDSTIFSPCALGGILTKENIDNINATYIIGGANNQLKNSTAGELLSKKGILYAPDFVVNAGGLISVANEYKTDSSNEDQIQKEIDEIPHKVLNLFKQSKRTKIPPEQIARDMAEEIFNKI